MFNRKLKQRIKELEAINEQHRVLNGKQQEEIADLANEVRHLKDEMDIWQNLYEAELHSGV